MSRYFQGRCHAAVSDSVMLSFKFTSLRLQTNEPFSSDWKIIKQNILVISQNFTTFEGSFLKISGRIGEKCQLYD